MHPSSETSNHRTIESTALFCQKTHTQGSGNFGHQQRGVGGGGQPNKGHYDSQYKPHLQNSQKAVVVCEVCGYRGHTKEQCFKVKGYPAGWKSKKKGATSYSHNSYANQTEVFQPDATSSNLPAPTGFFTQSQYQQIMQMLAKGTENAGEHSVKAASTGSILSALVSKYVPMEWIVDTGATDHMTASLDALDIIQPVPNSDKREVQLPTGNVTSVFTHWENKSVWKPKYQQCAICSRLQDLSNGLVRRIGREEQGLYILKEDFINSVTAVHVPSAHQSSQIESISLWHRRLGHAPIDIIKKSTGLDLVQTTVDLSCTVHNLFSTTVKTFRSDNGSEFFSHEFQSLLSTLGILHQSTCTYTPQQNGVAEKKHRTILDMARALRNVVFKEDVFPFKDLQTSSNPFFPVLTTPTHTVDPPSTSPPPPPLFPHLPSILFDVYTDEPSPSTDLSPQIYALPTRKSSRKTKPPLWLQDFVTANHSTSSSYPISAHLSYAHLSLAYAHTLAVYSAISEPSSYSEASLDPKWIQAMQL
ncbi:uncharacterized protein LOC129884054 [Solanum dulcamara]|uniref:uncharacterized protein LOC129884054 n=1 Tax=Solanum dulcamara TaxID=45834 RepID=UPI002485F682|nr:uncharacterized protein LOC129884054 [Solanum dulcamara]